MTYALMFGKIPRCHVVSELLTGVVLTLLHSCHYITIGKVYVNGGRALLRGMDLS